MGRFRLENRYQDSGWGPTGHEFNTAMEALWEAKEMAKDAISWGMVRVIDDSLCTIVETFAAGGGVAL